MPNIKPVSDLRNYNEVLRDISGKENGRTDINEVENLIGASNG